MVRRLFVFIVMITTISLFTACSDQEPIDLALVDVELNTEPTAATANEEVKLLARLVGISSSDGVEVSFDTRLDEKLTTVKGVDEGDDVYSGNFTFPQPGTYKVYIHITSGSLHVTKLKQVEVQ